MTALSSPPSISRIKRVLAALNRQVGRGAVMLLGPDGSGAKRVSALPSGFAPLDAALGIGGLPRGRVMEVYGPPDCGKTTLALRCMARAQNAGGVAAFIDAEHALDIDYARRLGIVTDRLLLCQPDSGEQGLDICERIVRADIADIVVVDTVAALTPQAEIDGAVGSQNPALQARLMSQALRKLTAALRGSKTVVVFVNQTRHRMDARYGATETTAGGDALKFYASVRLDVRPVAAGEPGAVRVRVAKNKLALPGSSVELSIGVARPQEAPSALALAA